LFLFASQVYLLLQSTFSLLKEIILQRKSIIQNSNIFLSLSIYFLEINGIDKQKDGSFALLNGS